MTRAAWIAVAAALLLAGTSLATAKSRGAAGAQGKPFHPGINETTSRPTAADPYYRLADPYYGGYSDTSRPTVADPYYRLSDCTMAIPIRIAAYTTSMLCRLTIRVTALTAM